VATCCNAPMLLDFTQGHWLTVYKSRLPAEVRQPQMRVNTGERPAGVALPDDLPNYAGYSPAFMIKLLLSWAAMGFRRPRMIW
jgi:hypothetical protein